MKPLLCTLRQIPGSIGCSTHPLSCEGLRAVRGDERGVLPVLSEIDGGLGGFSIALESRSNLQAGFGIRWRCGRTALPRVFPCPPITAFHFGRRGFRPPFAATIILFKCGGIPYNGTLVTFPFWGSRTVAAILRAGLRTSEERDNTPSGTT